MTEILTESFCERCGTRYTFESNAPRRSRVGRVRTLSKGLRNFVLSDESSFSEALADARSEEELSATAHQLDAFHKTFNFCLTCRQYTCGTCWNQTEGRCLTCAPLPDADVAAEYPQALPLGTDGHEHGEIEEAWPEADLEHINAVLGLPAAPESLQDATETQAADATLPEPEDTIETEAADATIPDPATAASGAGTWPADIKATAAPDDHPEMAAPDDHSDAEWAAAAAAAASSSETELIGVAPGQSLEDAIAAYESRLDEQELAEASAAASAAERADAASTAEPGFDTPGLMGPTETATETEAPRPPEAPSEPTADEATTSPEEMAAAEAAPGRHAAVAACCRTDRRHRTADLAGRPGGPTDVGRRARSRSVRAVHACAEHAAVAGTR